MPIRNVLKDIEQVVEIPFKDVVNSTPSQLVQKLAAKVGYDIKEISYDLHAAVAGALHIVVRGKAVMSETYQAGAELVESPVLKDPAAEGAAALQASKDALNAALSPPVGDPTVKTSA